MKIKKGTILYCHTSYPGRYFNSMRLFTSGCNYIVDSLEYEGAEICLSIIDDRGRTSWFQAKQKGNLHFNNWFMTLSEARDNKISELLDV